MVKRTLRPLWLGQNATNLHGGSNYSYQSAKSAHKTTGMLDLFDRSEGLSVDTAPVLVWHGGGLWWCESGQQPKQLAAQALSTALTKDAPLVCHMPALARRGGMARFRALDVLELFAFVRPSRTVTPTIKSLSCAAVARRTRRQRHVRADLAAARCARFGADPAGRAGRLWRDRPGDALRGVWIAARAHWPWAQPIVRGLAATAGDAALRPRARTNPAPCGCGSAWIPGRRKPPRAVRAPTP